VLRAAATARSAEISTRSQIHPFNPNAEVSSRSGHIAAAAKRVWVAPVALGFGALGCATGGDGDGVG